MTTYYTEYPTGQFTAASDEEALKKTCAAVVYKESDTPDGTPFIDLRLPHPSRRGLAHNLHPFKD